MTDRNVTNDALEAASDLLLYVITHGSPDAERAKELDETDVAALHALTVLMWHAAREAER